MAIAANNRARDRYHFQPLAKMESDLKRFATIAAVVVLTLTALTARAAEIPPAAARPVDFQKDVVPILQGACVTCHSSGKTEADLSIETREKLLEGGASEPAIVPGNSAESLLIKLVSGVDEDPERFMPKKGKKLTAEQIGVLRTWIDQGAKWPEDFILTDPAKPEPAKLEPRNVAIPAAHDGISNPIDLLLEPYFAKHNVNPAKLVDDRTFARRVYLDLVGLLPPPEELDAFVADQSTDKRPQLVHKLLADNHRYATHWLSFWNDLLRNDYKGTGYVDGGRKQITPWLYNALAENMRYDQFVRELVTGANGSDGFVKGIVWRGVVNAAQTPQMQAAQNISQVFMGVNLKCASCHDSFINQWKLTDSYGFAGVYADKPIEMERCTKPLGETAKIQFLYPQLGEIDQSLPREKRIDKLAQIITKADNGRLTRTIVNRLWQRFLGRGLIEPVDEMDMKPWSADVLDALAWDLAKHYDLKKTIETIVLSNAYQMPAVPAAGEVKEGYVFAGPTVRRLTAEQFADAVATVTGVWPAKAAANLDSPDRFGTAKWIWNDANAAKASPVGKVYFRRELELGPDINEAIALVAADNTFTLYVNGREVGDGKDNWKEPETIDLKGYLAEGRNVIAVAAANTSDKPNPAGFFFRLDLRYRKPVKNVKRLQIDSDEQWTWSTSLPGSADLAWTTVEFDDAGWKKAVALGDASAAPWKTVEKVSAVAATKDLGPRPKENRAALCLADPLTVALGRPNREQVNTVRPTEATTLQALELTNGKTLAELLDRGATKMAAAKDAKTNDVVTRIYQTALGRPPTASELAVATQVVGEQSVSKDGVEDLLWAVFALPEFQLIR
jgi:hypothetical protein